MVYERLVLIRRIKYFEQLIQEELQKSPSYSTYLWIESYQTKIKQIQSYLERLMPLSRVELLIAIRRLNYAIKLKLENQTLTKNL